jgi:hypothetical protein
MKGELAWNSADHIYWTRNDNDNIVWAGGAYLRTEHSDSIIDLDYSYPEIIDVSLYETGDFLIRVDASAEKVEGVCKVINVTGDDYSTISFTDDFQDIDNDNFINQNNSKTTKIMTYIDNGVVFVTLRVLDIFGLASNNPPTILSGSMAADNTYIDVVFSEGVYGANDGSTPAALADFTVTFAQNGGTATDWAESSAKQNDSAVEGSASALAGGETTIRIFGAATGTPDGNETLTITPTDGASLYDSSGLAMDAGQTTGAVNLTDESTIILFEDDFAGGTIDTAKWNSNPSIDIGITQNNELIFTDLTNNGSPASADIDTSGKFTIATSGVTTVLKYTLDQSSLTDKSSYRTFDFRNAADTNLIRLLRDSTAPNTEGFFLIKEGGSTTSNIDTNADMGGSWKIVLDGAGTATIYRWETGAWASKGSGSYNEDTYYIRIVRALNSVLNDVWKIDNVYVTDTDFATENPS